MNKSINAQLKSGISGLILLILFCLFFTNSYAQVVADFTADDTEGCTPMIVHFTNTGSCPSNCSYKWYFGVVGTSTLENPSFTFNSPGVYTVSFVITNNVSPFDKDSTSREITVFLTPSANLTIDSTNACVRGKVIFQAGFSTKDSARWDFGDGTTFLSYSSYMSHIYTAHNTYPVTYITYYQECSDTSNYLVKVDGPIAEINIVPAEACKGIPVEFTMVPVLDVTSHVWNLGEGDTQIGNPVTHTYETMGYNIILLNISGASGNCEIEDTVHIYEVVASFTPSDTLCDQRLVYFNNTSTGNTENLWNFGNGNTSMAENGTSFYNAGSYTVRLLVENSANCADSTEQEITINELPEVQMIENPVTCPGDPVGLSVVGGDSVAWFPPEEFDDPHGYTPTVTPDSTSTYIAIVTNTATHCSNSGEVTVIVQPGFIQGKISVFPTDTALIIGETFDVTVYDTLNRDLSYAWTPDTWISCTDCADPVFQPLETTAYTLIVSDTNQCFSSESFVITIEVTEEYSIGVPKAFTPNGDQVNDIIKVDGWGIKRLIEFRIFNRWGTEVFFTDDINQGWDGYYKEKLQNIDSYSYSIKAERWDDNEITVKGTFTLLR
jgi:gliding motility-associated-like protein